MGTVHLTNGHHHLYIRDDEPDLEFREVLTPEILARPVLTMAAEWVPVNQTYEGIIRAALQALMEMHGFDAAVSCRVIDWKGVPHIGLPHRTWGEITLKRPDNVVARFSHDSRRQNEPFRSLIQWLEEKNPGSGLSAAQFAEFAAEWSRPDTWSSFFHERIRRSMDVLYTEAGDLQRKGNELMRKAMAIESVLEIS